MTDPESPRAAGLTAKGCHTFSYIDAPRDAATPLRHGRLIHDLPIQTRPIGRRMPLGDLPCA